MASRETERIYFLKDETKQQKYCYSYALVIPCFAFSIIYIERG